VRPLVAWLVGSVVVGDAGAHAVAEPLEIEAWSGPIDRATVEGTWAERELGSTSLAFGGEAELAAADGAHAYELVPHVAIERSFGAASMSLGAGLAFEGAGWEAEPELELAIALPLPGGARLVLSLEWEVP